MGACVGKPGAAHPHEQQSGPAKPDAASGGAQQPRQLSSERSRLPVELAPSQSASVRGDRYLLGPLDGNSSVHSGRANAGAAPPVSAADEPGSLYPGGAGMSQLVSLLQVGGGWVGRTSMRDVGCCMPTHTAASLAGAALADTSTAACAAVAPAGPTCAAPAL
jgi:hypothetical protein